MGYRNKWNWQQADWPEFTYDQNKLKALEEEFLHRSGLLIGATMHISEDEQQSLVIDLMSEEAIKTSEIEGEHLNRDSVQSSIRRGLGLTAESRGVKPAEAGIAEMMLDLYKGINDPLNQEKLFAWHAMLMNGRRDLQNIGSYRSHLDPMEIVSGRLDEPTVHFEAPPSDRIKREMKLFIKWFNDTAPGGRAPIPALTRAGITHLYFESIHPFEDGNGRIGRSLSEKALAQSLGKPVMIALSHTIHENRKAYYTMLERSNKSNRIDEWLLYFANTVLMAQESSMKIVRFIISKTKFYDNFRNVLNGRQQKVLARVFREGASGFEGGLSAENYLAITGTSRATATRDLADLVEKGALSKSGKGKGMRYRLVLMV